MPTFGKAYSMGDNALYPTERRAPRFTVEQVVAVRSVNGELSETTGITRDVSSCGIYFYTETPLPVGCEVELFMMMPAQTLLIDSNFPLFATGHVVRRENLDEQFGIGVAIERMQVVAQA